MPNVWRVQSPYAGIRREARRIGTLRDHDGRAPGTPRRHDGYDHRRHGPGRPTWGLLSKHPLAGQAGDGYPDGHEEPDRRERTDSECDGGSEEQGLTTEGTESRRGSVLLWLSLGFM